MKYNKKNVYFHREILVLNFKMYQNACMIKSSNKMRANKSN